MPRANPKAKEAMILTHKHRITLKEAWDYIKFGKEPTLMCPCPEEEKKKAVAKTKPPVPPKSWRKKKDDVDEFGLSEVLIHTPLDDNYPDIPPNPPKRGKGYEKVATKYAKYMKTKKE
jgi:hypothetical protein